MPERKKTEIKFFTLCILGRAHSNHYEISSKIRDQLDISLTGYGLKREGNLNDHESWCSWNGTIKLGNSTENCNIKIKHFKVRIIIEVTRAYEDTDFVVLFKKAREGREIIKKDDLIKNILGITIPDHVKKIYSFPFIQIDKEYKSSDFDKLGDESITSFSYEVHDARRENILSLFFWRPKKTLLRISRPSIITTKMSNFMQAEIINIVHETCLTSLRKTDSTEPSEKIFQKMRKYIGTVLFEHEEIVAEAELARSVNTLSIIVIFGAIAGIIAIISIFSDPKTWVGYVLLVFTIMVLVLVLLSKKHQ
jgi:hypothetical protein